MKFEKTVINLPFGGRLSSEQELVRGPRRAATLILMLGLATATGVLCILITRCANS